MIDLSIQEYIVIDTIINISLRYSLASKFIVALCATIFF